MDSDDEKFLDEAEEELNKGKSWFFRRISLSPDGPDVRMYHKREREMLATAARLDDPLRNFAQFKPLLVHYRIERFCRTLEGFHTGYLDLTGRHKHRYNSFIKRWSTFLYDISQVTSLLSIPDPNSGILDDDDEFLALCPPDRPAAAEAVQAFGKKWRINSSSKGMMWDVFESVKQAVTTQAERPLPVFQQLCLVDLPAELLHEVFVHMDLPGARYLSSTCKLLREVSFRYIYHHRALCLRTLDYSKLPPAEEDRMQVAMAGMLASKTRLMDQMQSIIDSGDPRFIQAIASLRVGGWHQNEDLALAGIVGDCEERRRYYGLLLMALGVILSEAVNIQTLSIANWDLSADLVPAVLSLPHLHTAAFMDCRIWPGVVRHVPSSILNAHISVRSLAGLRAWTFVGGMPLLRVLSAAKWSDIDDPLFPPPTVRATMNPFKTVERVSIHQASHDDFDDLIDWILSAKRTSGSIPLAYFKVEAGPAGIIREAVIDLLHATRGSSMRRLSLDGIHWADPEILREIGRCFPHLESLSLQYRQSLRQTRTESARWPAPTWEYAKAFSSCRHLKHFIWNQWVDTFEPETAILTYMEKGWPEEELWTEAHDEASNLYDDWDCVAKLFAVYGRSLETVSFSARGLPRFHFKICRTSTGIEIESRSVYSDGTLRFLEQWDPPDFASTWAHVHTAASKEST